MYGHGKRRKNDRPPPEGIEKNITLETIFAYSKVCGRIVMQYLD